MYLGKRIKNVWGEYVEVYPAGTWADISFLAALPKSAKRITDSESRKGQTPMLVEVSLLPTLVTHCSNNR